MYDIQIITSRGEQAVVSGISDRGKRWIHTHMTEDSPCSIKAEAVREVEDLITKDGLTVVVR